MRWIIGNEKITKDICNEHLKLCDENEDDYMITFLNSIISGKSTFEGGMYVWSTIGNYGVLYHDDLIPLFKKLYEFNAINPFSNVIILSQTENCPMTISELSWNGKDIEVRENYDNKLVWRQ